MNVRLADESWLKILACLRSEPHVYVGNEAKTRRFLEAFLWISRSGSQWRLLPDAYGNWNSIYKRFARWQKLGVWQHLLQYVASDPDLENVILDSTIVRAHPCAAGARKIDGGQAAQALGRSAGGFSTKIHITVDGLGNPLRVQLSAGQRHDISQAPDLIVGLKFKRAIADRGYAAEPFLDLIRAQGAEPVIPSHPRSRVKREYDTWLYRERHLVECFINKIKHFRRVFARFDKLDARYLAIVQFVCALIWLR
jgi:transposase